jgi:small conductance mechanosensitive channel
MKELAQLDATELVAKLIGKLEGWVEAFFVMLPNVLLAALILGMGALVARFVQQGVQGVLIKTTGNQPISRMIGSLSRIAIVGMSALWALGLLHLDKTVTSMLAGVGVVGLALGFAFQDIAANDTTQCDEAVIFRTAIFGCIESHGNCGRNFQAARHGHLVESNA